MLAGYVENFSNGIKCPNQKWKNILNNFVIERSAMSSYHGRWQQNLNDDSDSKENGKNTM